MVFTYIVKYVITMLEGEIVVVGGRIAILKMNSLY